jgi:hypothetical protein
MLHAARIASAARARERGAALCFRVTFDEKDQTGILARRKVCAPLQSASAMRGIAGRLTKRKAPSAITQSGHKNAADYKGQPR